MMYFRLTLLWLGLCLSSPFVAAKSYEYKGFSYAIDPVPQWVHWITPDYQQTPGHNSDYLLVDDQSQWRADGQSHFFKVSTRANNLESLEQASRVEAYFIPEYQQLRWHSIDIIRDGERINRLDPEDIRVIQTEDELDNEMLVGQATGLVFIPDTRVGDVIEYSYTIEGTNPIFNNRFFRRYHVSWQDRVAHRHVRVLAPSGKSLHTRTSDPAHQVTVQTQANGTEYVLSVKDTAPIKYEKDYPADFQPQAMVEFTDFASWQAVSDWADPLYAERNLAHPELQTLLARLKTLPVEAAISEALYFAQNRIRYVGVELGVNSHLPRPPEKVMRDGYGDCKDKTLLLIALLEQLGVSAYPALVSTYREGAFAEMLPSPSHFDHVITLVEHEGKRWWVDPTRRFQKGKVSSIGYADYGYALPVGHPTSGPMAMTFSEAQQPVYEVREEYRILAYGGPTLLTVTNTFKAGKADYVRWQIATSGEQGLQEKYLDVVRAHHPEARILMPMQVREHAEIDQIVVTEGYVIPDFTQAAQQSNAWEYEATLFALSGYVDTPKILARQWPWALPNGSRLKHTVVIHHPEILNLENVSRDTHLTHRAFTFSARERAIQRQIINEVELSFTGAKSLAPNEVAGYADAMEQVKNRGFISYTVTNDESPRVAEAMNAVVPAIQPYLARPGNARGKQP